MTCPSQMPMALLTARLPSDLLPLCQVHAFLVSVYRFTVSHLAKEKEPSSPY